MTTRTLDVTLPALHPSQRTVRDHPARFKALACGRRWGKTRLGVALCVEAGLSGRRAWWVAPSYKVGNVGWRQLTRLAVQIPGVQVLKAERTIEFPGGGEVAVRSADNPDSLRGEGLDLVVMDECAFIQEDAWSEALRPALADRQGRAVFISTPKGRNWFWRVFQRGQMGEDSYASWQMPTSDNPYIDPAEVEAARAGMPDRIFRQEFLAEFLDDAGGVFRGVVQAATAAALERGVAGGQYAIGVDWGKSADFTALAVVDVGARALVHLDRFNQIDYAVQVGRLKALSERFKPFVVTAERNSMGDPLIEQLMRDGLPVQPFLTTNATKAAAMDALALAFERSEIRVIPDPVLIGELQAYEMERLPSGMFRYSAPEGMHDDTVMALALAWQACARPAWTFA